MGKFEDYIPYDINDKTLEQYNRLPPEKENKTEASAMCMYVTGDALMFMDKSISLIIIKPKKPSKMRHLEK